MFLETIVFEDLEVFEIVKIERDSMVVSEEARSRKCLCVCCACMLPGLYVFSKGNISIFVRACGRKAVERKILKIKVRNYRINGTSSQLRGKLSGQDCR